MDIEKKPPKEVDPTVGRNIRHLRLKRGLNISELANAIDSDVGNISRLERAKQGYSDEMIRKIADFFGVPVGLLFKSDLPFEQSSSDSDVQPTRLKATIWEDGDQDIEEFVEIPLIDVQFSAGSGCVELIEKEEFALIFRRHYLHKLGVSTSAAKLVRVIGTSMEPKLSDGDVVGINTDDTRIRDGKAYGIRHGDLLRVKFLIEQPDGGVIIRSMNREEFGDEKLTQQEKNDQLVILGRVFWSSSTW
ncbi:S24 family peptidase [Serratia fonticola]|uniref:XRE family transcriptional regulator n=1 Tax=Serratia fonticola TaxID=47917 RepID=UPI003AAD52F5